MHTRVALAACTIGLLLSGSSCSSGEPYGALPPTTPATSPPPPPPPPPPTLPEPTPPALATQDSAPGAEAFARFWLIALDYAYQTGNTKPFRSLGSCKTCVAVADGIDWLYSEGGHYEAGRLSAVESTTNRHVPNRAALVSLYYSREARRVVRGNGGIQIVQGAKRLGFLLTLARDSRWTVTQAQVI